MEVERVTLRQWLAKPTTDVCEISDAKSAAALLKRFFWQYLVMDHLNKLEAKLKEAEGAKAFSPFKLELTIKANGCETDWGGIQALAKILTNHLPSVILTRILAPQE